MADTNQLGLEQRDLSRLRVQEMSQQERAELRRRYVAFLNHFSAKPEPDEPPRKVRKWVPGEPTVTE